MYVYIVLLHFTVYYLAFYKFITEIYVNFLILLLYQDVFAQKKFLEDIFDYEICYRYN